jgi:pimeloyl-ACP methyl ester carboxylesterase
VAEFGKPALLLAGEYDVGLLPRNAAVYAGLFEHGEFAVQPGAGHFVRGERAYWCLRWLVRVDGGEVVPRSVELR